MAIASSDHDTPSVEVGTRFDVSARFMKLFGAVCSVPIVQRVAIDDGNDCLDLWILLRHDDDAEEELIYRHLQAYRAARSRPSVDAHVVTVSERPEAFPGDIPVVFERT